MATVRLRSAKFTEAGLRRALNAPNGGLVRDIYRRTKLVENEAKRLAPVDTGRLRSSIVGEVRHRGGLVYGRVGTRVRYARYVHNGTGIYGPKHAWITPKKGKFLVFKPKGSVRRRNARGQFQSDKIFARRVRGVRPTPFLSRALLAAS